MGFQDIGLEEQILSIGSYTRSKMDLYLLLKLDITINGSNSCWGDFPYIVNT